MTLTALLGIPTIGAVLVALVGRGSKERARSGAIVVALGELAMAAYVVWRFVAGGAPLKEAYSLGKVSFWHLWFDGLAAPLVLLTAFLGVIAILASWEVEESPGGHHALLLALEAAVMGVFLAGDYVVFYVAWEAVLIPMYFLIGVWGHEDRRHAAMKFFIYTFAGSALMLVGLLMALFTTNSLLIGDVGGAAQAGAGAKTLMFWLLAAGFLVKIPVFPLHTWLPDAHVEAPTAGSIMLAGVLLKMGAYGLLRIALPLAPEAFVAARGVLAALGIIGILYGAAMALAQTDLKRLVAYSSVSHMGFVVLAIAALTPLSFGAAMLGMVSHGLVAGLLFLLVGLLYDRTHTREIARFGGLAGRLPIWATAFAFAALASAGLPALSGFPGEFLAVTESFKTFGWWVALAAVGVVVAAAYNLYAVKRVSHGALPESGLPDGMRDLGVREALAVAPLALGVVVLGVWPGAVLQVMQVAIAALGRYLGGAL